MADQERRTRSTGVFGLRAKEIGARYGRLAARPSSTAIVSASLLRAGSADDDNSSSLTARGTFDPQVEGRQSDKVETSTGRLDH